MRTILATLMLSLASVSALGAEPRVERDLPYVDPKNPEQCLDIYAPAEGQDHPIVIWIHGDGRRNLDKSTMDKKPQAFVDKGYLFVPINYRAVPQNAMKLAMDDVVHAIHWVHEHAKQYGGDPKKIFVMGHSTGSHMAALVCTDESYLRGVGGSLAAIKGCVNLECPGYDMVAEVKNYQENEMLGKVKFYKSLYGDDEQTQRDLSPLTHVAKDKHIPPFLLFHYGTWQSGPFSEALKQAGVKVVLQRLEPGKSYYTMNSELGEPGDKLTEQVFEFLDTVQKIDNEQNKK